VSLVFWYLGLVPDLAALRDQAKKRWQQIVYGLLPSLARQRYPLATL